MKGIIKIVIVLIIAVLAYNYYLGTQTEKESTEHIVNEIKDVGSALKDLIVNEKEKFDQGKYDKVKDQLNNLVEQLKDGSINLKNLKDVDWDKLRDEQNNIEKNLDQLESEESIDDETKKEIKEMMEETRRLIEELKNELSN